MPVVLVHGNPETDAVWAPLVAELDRSDVVRLSPPGWGAPIPDGWGATVEEYRRWLVGELETIASRSTSSATTGVGVTPPPLR